MIIPTVIVPTITVTPVTLPADPTVTVPTITMPAVPSMPVIPALGAGTAGFPPALPDIASLQAGISSVITAAKSALESKVTEATDQIKNAGAMLKLKSDEFKTSLSAAKTQLISQFNGKTPTKTEITQINTALKLSEDSFKVIKDNAITQLKTLQDTIASAPAKMEAMATQAKAAMDGIKTGMKSLTDLLG